jgi:hypothetical protein
MRRLPRLVAEKILGQEQNIRWPLRQTPHKVGIPLGAERDINPHAPAILYQTLLQVAPYAVQHLKLEGVMRDRLARGESFGLVNDGFIVGREAVVDAALHQSLHQFDVVAIDLGLLLEGNLRRFLVRSLAEAYAYPFGQQLCDVSLGAPHVRLYYCSHTAFISRNTVQFVNEVESSLGVGRSFHVDANKILGRHAGGFGDQSADDVVGHFFIHVEAHVGELKADIRIEFVGGNFVEQFVVKVGAGAGFVSIRNVLAQIVDRDSSSKLIYRGSSANRIGDVVAGDEASGIAPAKAGALCYGAQGAALGKSYEEGS